MGVGLGETAPSKSIISPTRSEDPASESHGVLNWDAVFFVHAVWLVMAGLAYYLVWSYGSPVFYEDDWLFVPVLTGNETLTLEWLWRQNNEHRLPLSGLLILGLYSTFDFDARSGMVCTVTLLAALALLMVWTVRHVRGRTLYSDALFPMVMLQWGQYDNFLFGHQVYQGLPVFLAGALMCIMVWSGTRMSLRATMLAGICVTALSLCGSMGIVFAPAMACWFLAFPLASVLAGRGSTDTGETKPTLTCGRRCSVVALVFAAIIGVTAVVYFIGFKNYYVVEGNQFPNHLPSPSTFATLVTATKFLSMGYGSLGPLAWRASGIFIVALILITTSVLMVIWYTRRGERLRALGLLSYLGAMVVLAVGIGVGRAGMGTHVGFSSRYVSLALLVPSVSYMVFVIVGGGMGRYVQMILFTIGCIAVIPNMQTGASLGARHYRFLKAFEDDLLAGAPPVALAAHHTIGESPVNTCRILRSEPSLQVEFIKLMRMAHQRGKGIYRNLNDVPTMEKPLGRPAPIRTHDVKWRMDGTAECVGDDPHMTFDLGRPEHVIAIRLHYGVSKTPPPLQFEAYWRNSTKEEFTEKERYYRTLLPPDGEERKLVARDFHPNESWRKQRAGESIDRFWVTIPVDAFIDEFRIDPNNGPCDFKIEEIVLVVPAAIDTRRTASSATPGL